MDGRSGELNEKFMNWNDKGGGRSENVSDAFDRSNEDVDKEQKCFMQRRRELRIREHISEL